MYSQGRSSREYIQVPEGYTSKIFMIRLTCIMERVLFSMVFQAKSSCTLGYIRGGLTRSKGHSLSCL